MNHLIQPYANPVRFHEMNPSQLPQYLSKFMDDWSFEETIKPWEERVKFCQPWIQDDSIRLQYITNYAPLYLKVYNRLNHELHSQLFDTMQQDFFRPGYFIRQVELDLAPFDPADFYLVIECGAPASLLLVSDPLSLFASNDFRVSNTTLVEYSHHVAYADLVFDAPFAPSIRVPSWNRYKEPGSKDTMFIDQTYNNQMVKSVPYDIFSFIMGGESGVPPSFIKKMNIIMGCSNLKIDGRFWSKATEGAKWEEIEVEDRPTSGWRIDLMPKFNRTSIEYQNDVPVIGMNSMMAVIDTKGFGLVDNSGNDFQEILDVN
jgi:hypothetical protein